MTMDYLVVSVMFFIIGVPCLIIGLVWFRKGPFLSSWIYIALGAIPVPVFFLYLMLMDDSVFPVECWSIVIGLLVLTTVGPILFRRYWGEYSIMNVAFSRVPSYIEDSLEAAGIPFTESQPGYYKCHSDQDMSYVENSFQGSVMLRFHNWHRDRDKRRFLKRLRERLSKEDGPIYKMGGLALFGGVVVCGLGILMLI